MALLPEQHLDYASHHEQDINGEGSRCPLSSALGVQNSRIVAQPFPQREPLPYKEEDLSPNWR